MHAFSPANAFVRQALSDVSEIVNVSLSEAVRENKSVFMNLVLFIFLAKINILICANPKSCK